ncbi:hypothetical protein L195_g035903 [Trifolium pratense]|uniref:Uncharacterized protein n=1 Tax=Trifolium pratense TaxID=57577 RepID=A0A2K3LN03_TRIPR|nr:hypothetical protein L195_g035903 [Trifolium pratense]
MPTKQPEHSSTDATTTNENQPPQLRQWSGGEQTRNGFSDLSNRLNKIKAQSSQDRLRSRSDCSRVVLDGGRRLL